ncbi:hypothetical protein QTI51_32435 [Variovorax sp. J22G73]|uniref:hypothetical protein n=1 Tax=unclassified Variovorax TaxID=663243 RepID=UPI0025778D71|nr:MULTISPECIES: hypothetical protein [unclassified Variovorax]MDM0009515.1 hypothetical protein [Variovorax sp. J22R203]MDM0102023.1 hypothetical protein [Variovorax sp. J22G73]
MTDTSTNDKDSSGADRTGPVGDAHQLPAQKAMKQFSKTDAERDAPVGPNDGPALTQREGDDKPPAAI